MVKATGIPETMKELTMSVPGMHCDGCESSVETGLGQLEGVRSVDADAETGTVRVVVDAEIDESELKETVEATGFVVEKVSVD